jgi:hypothetical protein
VASWTGRRSFAKYPAIVRGSASLIKTGPRINSRADDYLQGFLTI